MQRNKLLPNVIKTAATTTEPVTTAEVKLEGRIDFTTDDDYILSLIPSSREKIEESTATSLIEKEIIATIESCNDNVGLQNNWIELPYGPVQSIDDVTDEDGETLTEDDDYELRNDEGEFIEFRPLTSGIFKIYYTAGYETIPAIGKQAIIRETVDAYENKPMAERSACAMAKPLKRFQWI